MAGEGSAGQLRDITRTRQKRWRARAGNATHRQRHDLRALTRTGETEGRRALLENPAPAKLADAPDLGLRNPRFQGVAFHFKRRPFYEGKTALWQKSFVFAINEQNGRHSAQILAHELRIRFCFPHSTDNGIRT